MWISRQMFTELVKDRSEASGVAQALEKQNIALQATMDWLRMRLTQLEHERAQLIYNYMGVKINVPTLEPAPTAKLSDIVNEAVSFDDMGDTEAAKLGIGWNEAGEVEYGGKK